ncbi:S8 family peptidase [Desulfotomaculum sp. 1211_IL3151]|uniref:S8 family peptidase n=1 Tax=Desulfotomaculum sp. 1211_IL3151 TaxID=3084055 RepID=UPI002FD8D616
MKDKNLPIKIFEKRLDVDERLTEPGGNENIPKWVLRGAPLKTKSELLIDDMVYAYKKIENKFEKYKNIPTVIKAKVIDDAVAKSHRNDISQLFHSKKKDNIIGFSDNQELYVRIDNIKEIPKILERIDEYEINAKAISAIEEIKIFEPIIDDTPPTKKEDNYLYKVKLIDFNNYQINKYVLETFKKLLSDNLNCSLLKTVKYSDNLKVHVISTDSLELTQKIQDFSAILSIEPMPLLEVSQDHFFSDTQFPLISPDKNIDYPTVGILDSGIAKIPQLAPWVVGSNTSYPEEYVDRSHGTFVAGVICLGDIFEGVEYTGLRGCWLFDATVIPDLTKEQVSEADLVDNIREVIQKYRNKIKIWNMSLGSQTEAKLDEFSDFGIALDNIQDENDVLIFKSAGNCKNFINQIPNSRIAKGADSVRCLTVGSIAHSQNANDIAQYNQLSPFSRVGPGPAYIIKPELVHYGGNCGFSNGKVVPNGVTSLGIDGQIKRNIGTSFSTPRLSAIAADLYNKMEEDFDSVLIKALILHSAKYPREAILPINEKINQLGFGITSNASSILYNDPNEITVVLRDTLNKGEFIEILDFPYPSCLIDKQDYYYGQILLTVVSNPILESGQGPEYCQSNIDVKFGTYDSKTRRDMTKKTIRNPIGRDGGQNLLNSSNYSKKKPAEIAERFALTEKMLVQYGDKYYPNKKYGIDLSELTPSNKDKYSKSPKNWFLKVTGLYRDYIEKKAIIERDDLSQEFCIVLTIRDPFGEKPVYNEVSALLESNNFIHRNIKLKQTIDVLVNSY